MSKHTPGPWFKGESGFNLGNGVVYARHLEGSPNDICIIRGWGETQMANAQLIAAAPDLLAALEEIALLTSKPGRVPVSVISVTARAAIAKAKGEA